MSIETTKVLVTLQTRDIPLYDYVGERIGLDRSKLFNLILPNAVLQAFTQSKAVSRDELLLELESNTIAARKVIAATRDTLDAREAVESMSKGIIRKAPKSKPRKRSKKS